VTNNAWAIQYIEYPSLNSIKLALNHREVIKYPLVYERVVKIVFKNNTLLIKKWLRYGETMRGADEKLS
jgi:hypothetical protein